MPRSRRPRVDGELSRHRIPTIAAMLATKMGLEGLTISAVAEACEMSKGGVSAHFASKLSLQLAAIDAASTIFEREVIAPALAHEGLARLRAVAEADVSYVERRVFPGGCFFLAATAEMCGREGPVRDRIAEAHVGWMGFLEGTIADAVARGELRADVDGPRLAFDLHALMTSANFGFTLTDDPAVLALARASIAERIDRELA